MSGRLGAAHRISDQPEILTPSVQQLGEREEAPEPENAPEQGAPTFHGRNKWDQAPKGSIVRFTFLILFFASSSSKDSAIKTIREVSSPACSGQAPPANLRNVTKALAWLFALRLFFSVGERRSPLSL